MSINDVHEELMANLSSAMDMGKFLGVFNTLIGVIRDQQTKIDELNTKSEELASLVEENANRIPEPLVQVEEAPKVDPVNAELVERLENKINALEEKLNDTLLELHGLGEDRSILDHGDSARELLNLPNSLKFVPGLSTSKEADEYEGFSSRRSSKLSSKSPSAANSTKVSANNSTANSAVNSTANSVANSAAPSRVTSATSRAASRVPSRRSSRDGKNPGEDGDDDRNDANEGEDDILEEGSQENGDEDLDEEGFEPPPTEEAEPTVEADDTATSMANLIRDTSVNNLSSVPMESAEENEDSEAVDTGNANSRSASARRSRNASPLPEAGSGSPERIASAGPARKKVTMAVADDSAEGFSADSASRLSPALMNTASQDADETDPNKLAPHALAKATQAAKLQNTKSSIIFPKGLLQVTPLELRPTSMQMQSFSSKMQAGNFLFPNMDEQGITPKSAKVAKALWKASLQAGMDQNMAKQYPHLHRRIIPHYHKYHMDAKLSHDRLVALADYKEIRSHDHKDKMEVNNLKFLTPEKRHVLCQLLMQKGRLIQISKNILEESRIKYASRSLKQNVEYVEAETRRLHTKLKNLQNVLKKQHVALRYVLPLDFHETFDRLVDFLEHLEVKGGIEEIMALPRSDSIVCYDEYGNLPKSVIDAITAKLRPVILQELSGLKTQMASLKEDSVTHISLSELMVPDSAVNSSTHSRSGSVSEAVSKDRELARKRMVLLIKETIAEDRKVYQEEQRILDEENRHRTTVGIMLQSSGLASITSATGSVNPTMRSPGGTIIKQRDPAKTSAEFSSSEKLTTDSSSGAALTSANKEYVDAQLLALTTQLEALQSQQTVAKDTTATEMSELYSKLEMLEQANHVMLERESELKEQRKRDSEQLKIMQKRLATVSVDNVLDELKLLQLQVNDRPSTTDVSNMMEGISHTFRKHLGENVIGLRGLVDQVYRQIHHKVNREDIKKLISAKLSLMEQDILKREEEMFSAASSTRCMSCGQLPPDPTNAFVNHTAARRAQNTHHTHHPNHSSTGGGSHQGGLNSAGDKRSVQIPTMGSGFLKASGSRPGTSPHLLATSSGHTDIHHNVDPSSSSLLFNPPFEGSGDVPMDDEISLHSEQNAHHYASSSPSQQQQQQQQQQHLVNNNPRSEEIYNVITGSAGLKSLMPQHVPLQPVRDPYNLTTTNKRNNKTNTIPEPLYRKAKLAAHLKEMVKVSAPSAQNYGYSGNNPFFVLEGFAEDDPNNTSGGGGVEAGNSLYSNGGGKSRRPRTTQGTVSALSVTGGNSQVYVPIPRNSAQPNSATNQLLMSASANIVHSNAELNVGTVLPVIGNKST